MATLIVVLETMADSAASAEADAALSALSGRIVSLGMYDVERELAAVYFVPGEGESDFVSDSCACKARTESELLEDWWEGAVSYDTFVTFNGLSFTVPFLYHRSARSRIRPTIEIARQRYLTKQKLPYHVDLLEELSFYRAMRPGPSLQSLCAAYDISFTALEAQERAEMLLAQHFRALATHNVAKLHALRQLYDLWREYFAPRSFLNALEI